MVVLQYECHCLQHTAADCLDEIYVLAFTSGLSYAGSDDCPKIEIQAGGHIRSLNLPDLPGNEHQKNKGDLWKIEISDFSFPGCITTRDIEKISIEEDGNDGWNIDSIVTFFKSNPDSYQLASVDFDENRWIDGDQEVSEERFELNLVL